jgi:hypothetical protein
MKAMTSGSNRWRAEHVQMGRTTSIGALLRPFRPQGKTATQEIKSVLSRFTT